MGPFRKTLSLIIGWGLLMGGLCLPAHAEPAWIQRTPPVSSSTVWFVGRAFDQEDLTQARTRAQDAAFDDLMTVVGVGAVDALQQLEGSMGYAYRHISQVGKVSLRPVDEFVRRRTTEDGTRYDLWVLYDLPHTRFTELKSAWRKAAPPGVDPRRVWAQARVEAERQAHRDYLRAQDEAVSQRIKERQARENEKIAREGPLALLLIVLIFGPVFLLAPR